MASRLGSRRATLIVKPGSRYYKTLASAPPAFRSDSKFNELGAPKKDTPAPSYVSAPALLESTLALKYSEVDLMKILKIFSETKGQEPKAEVPDEQPLKVKILDVYFEKLHMDYYHFYQ